MRKLDPMFYMTLILGDTSCKMLDGIIYDIFYLLHDNSPEK